MAGREVTPIAQLGRRMPVAGRLRAGRKGAKGQPEKLNVWRATSHDQQAIRQIAERYGGAPQPWSDPKVAEGQWEVTTEATELPIVLPPEPLGNTPLYELWSGGGCQRRCDGVTCETTVSGPDGSEPAEVDCLCAQEGALACDPKTRLAVILPEVRFAGVWRIDTSSWNAARELPGMVDMVQALQAQAGGLARGVVALEERLHKKEIKGKLQTLKPIVPVLRVTHSPDEIAAGQADVGALHSRSGEPDDAPALEAGADSEAFEYEYPPDDPRHVHDTDAGGNCRNPDCGYNTEVEYEARIARGEDPDGHVVDAEVVGGDTDWIGLAGGKPRLAKTGNQVGRELGLDRPPSSADDAAELAESDHRFADALRERLEGST